MRRGRPAPLLLGLALAAAEIARADGGLPCGSGGAPPLRLTLWVAPTPVRVGPAELSVLVQSDGIAAGAAPPRVRLRVSRPDFCEPTRDLEAVPGGSGGTRPGAMVTLEMPGPVIVEAEASAGSVTARAICKLEVAPAASPLREHVALLSLPPAAVALYAGSRVLAARQAARRRRLIGLRRRS